MAKKYLKPGGLAGVLVPNLTASRHLIFWFFQLKPSINLGLSHPYINFHGTFFSPGTHENTPASQFHDE